MPKTSCLQHETLKVILVRDKTYGLGITISCGDTYDTILQGAFIQSILPGSPADNDGNLSPRDQILSVNGIDVQNAQYLDVVDLIKGASSPLEFIIAKSKNYIKSDSDQSALDISEPICMKLESWLSDETQSQLEASGHENSIEHIPRKEILSYGESNSLEEIKKSFYGVSELVNVQDAENYNLSTNYEKKKTKAVNCSIINEYMSDLSTTKSVPDIISTQIKQVNMLISDSSKHSAEINSSLADQTIHPCAKNSNNQDHQDDVYDVLLEKKYGSLGLNIYQGTDPVSSQSFIYVHSLIPGGAAETDGRIYPGDKLLEVNGILLENYSYQEIVNILRESPFTTHLVLEKQSSDQSSLQKSEVGADSFILANERKSSSDNLSNVTDLKWNNQNFESNSSQDVRKFQNPCKINDRHSYLQKQVGSSSLCNIPSSTYIGEISLDSLETAPPKDVNFAKDLGLPQAVKQSFVANDASLSGGIFNHSSPCLNEHSQNNCLTHSITANAIKNYSSPCRTKADSLHCDKSMKKTNVYRSTPNLADNTSDEDESYKKVANSLYRNKSTECLSSSSNILEMGLFNMYQDCHMERGSGNDSPVVENSIQSQKFKKLEDINKFLNSGNTHYVTLKKGSRGFGFSISGGKDNSKKDTFSQLISIRKLYPLQPAIECGELFVGDVILAVNGINMVGRKNTESLEILRSAAADVTLKLFRPTKSGIPSLSICKNLLPLVLHSPSSSSSSSLSRKDNYNAEELGKFEITLMKRGGSLGFTVSKNDENHVDGPPSGIYVKSLIREPAVSDGRIRPGDRIIKVNGKNISSMTHAEAVSFLRNAPEKVTLTLYRYEPPISPFECNPIPKQLRWEAIELLNDRIKNQDDIKAGTERKVKQTHKQDEQDIYSNGRSPSSSGSSSKENAENGQVFVMENMYDDGPGLQRSQRPKSLDVLNSSDRKHISEEEDNFHRQASVIDTLLNQKPKIDACSNDVNNKKGMKTLLKWRGSTLPNDENNELTDRNQTYGFEDQYDEVSGEHPKMSNYLIDGKHKDMPYDFDVQDVLDSMLEEEKDSASRVQTVDINLDRGWHSRLGFSLCDPPKEEKNSIRALLPNAAQVKAVYPGSLAAKDGRIRVGDRIVEVNSESLVRKKSVEVIDILKKTRGVIRMVFCRIE